MLAEVVWVDKALRGEKIFETKQKTNKIKQKQLSEDERKAFESKIKEQFKGVKPPKNMSKVVKNQPLFAQ